MPSTILVVEDDPDGQELIARMLFRAKIAVEITGTAEDALSLLSLDEHDAVVIDLALPGMDGFELLAQIRARDEWGGIPCVAITAFHTPALKQRVMKAGFDAYFPKPLDDNRFLEAIRELLDREPDAV